MADERSKANHCTGMRKTGEPCRSRVLGTDPWCFAHHPGKVAERAAAQRKGGYRRGSLARLHHLVPPRLVSVYDRLEGVLGELHRGEIDPRIAVAMAAVSRAMVAVLQVGELEERVRTLEQRGKEVPWPR
jgi:hypothetical protein